jgi:hypothetical protein
MKIVCCDLELMPHTLGTPRAGDACADYGCPKCGKQYEIVIWSKDAYERSVNANNAKRIAFGLKPEPIQVSETK